MARQVSKTIRLSGGRRARIKTVYVETPCGRTITRLEGTRTTVTVEPAEDTILGRVKRYRDDTTRRVIGLFTWMQPVPWRKP